MVKYSLRVQNFSARWRTGGARPGTGFLHFSEIAEEVIDGFRWNFMRQRLLKNASMDLHEMLCVDRCRNMDELVNFWARSALEALRNDALYKDNVYCTLLLYLHDKHQKPFTTRREEAGNCTYSRDSTEQATSWLADGNSGYQADSCGRRRNAGARSISRQPECRSHRTKFRCPSQCWTQRLFTPIIYNIVRSLYKNL